MVLTRSAIRRLATENAQKLQPKQKPEPNYVWLDMTVFVLPLVLYATTTVSIEQLITCYFILSALLALSYLAMVWVVQVLAEEELEAS
jgi:hypothetical protein